MKCIHAAYSRLFCSWFPGATLLILTYSEKLVNPLCAGWHIGQQQVFSISAGCKRCSKLGPRQVFCCQFDVIARYSPALRHRAAQTGHSYGIILAWWICYMCWFPGGSQLEEGGSGFPQSRFNRGGNCDPSYVSILVFSCCPHDPVDRQIEQECWHHASLSNTRLYLEECTSVLSNSALEVGIDLLDDPYKFSSDPITVHDLLAAFSVYTVKGLSAIRCFAQ